MSSTQTVVSTSEQFPIGSDERAVLVGKSDSGKTTLAKSLIIRWPHLLVIDPKAEFDLPHARRVSDPYELNRIKRGDERPTIFQPETRYWNAETYNGVFRWVYERKNCSLFVDEQFGVQDGLRAPEYERAICTRGRSRKIRFLVGTQRPSRVPLEILTEAKWYFLFQLSEEEDLKRMAGMMSSNPAERRVILETKLGEHHFWAYHHKSMNPAQICVLRLRGK